MQQVIRQELSSANAEETLGLVWFGFFFVPALLQIHVGSKLEFE